ncbi:hypothetical protein JRI60_26120 [Archangium violaceum]|uniref:hypothetical protein n=1 Tax=Archangium violaceum TaxID=83451 RepID=UPI001951EF53|nr:hypothetical protein [Archangium violaceum]QRO02245.1 hypothetical protein JRI60_26120 [Archangium violaceum]
MQVPTRAALLEELDSQGYRARLERVARIGHEARDSPSLPALMGELVAGDAHEATLALVMARAARNEAVLLRGLTHPSRAVRGRAASLAGKAIRDEAALEQVLPELPSMIRRRVLKGVALARRERLAARLLPVVRARHGDGEAALLLPALDTEDVRHLLPELAHAVRAWPTLVHRHPDTVLAFLQARFTGAAASERQGLFLTWDLPLRELLVLRCEAVLALVREHTTTALPELVVKALPRLVREYPEQLFELLGRPALRKGLNDRVLTQGMLREVARCFSFDQRLELARMLVDRQDLLTRLLQRVSPCERAALFTHAFDGVPPPRLQTKLLCALPLALRDAEVARQLERPEVREDRHQRLCLLALRTIEHSREQLQEAAFASDAHDRAMALSLLVASTGLSGRGVTETLTYLSRLKNEQDPVRREVLRALEAISGLYTSEHIPFLETLVTDALEARDTSEATRTALRVLTFELLRAHLMDHRGALFQFALRTMERLLGLDDSLDTLRLDGLPRGAEHHLVAALLPRIRAAGPHERARLIFALCETLGRRAWNVDMLQALLEPLTESEVEWHAHRAIQYWLESPRTRDQRVRKLLARDASAIIFPRVLAHLHRHRPESLEPYLEGRPLEGRFAVDGRGWVPVLREGFHRWLPRHQERYRELLLRIANDEVLCDWERTDVLYTLARLPVVTEKHLQPFLGWNDVPTVEAVLGAFGRLDRPGSALPLLLEHLDGDRARVAMYVLPGILEQLSPSHRTGTLASLLSRDRLKVTVHKELVRQLATARDPRALALLRQQWDKPHVHRDVCIAMGHAARRLLETEESAWDMMEILVRDPDPYVARSLLKQPPEALPARLRPRYAGLLFQLVDHPDSEVRQRTFHALIHWAAGLEERVARLAAARIVDLSSGDEWNAATLALVLVTLDGRAFEQVVDCVAALVSASMQEEPDAGPQGDLPAFNRLKQLIEALLVQPRPVVLGLRPRLAEVARVLTRDAALWPLSARIRVHCLTWKEAGPVADVLLGLAAETREEPFFAQALASMVASVMKFANEECAPELLLDVAARVRTGAPLVALELVREAGTRRYWRGAEARNLLRELRQHPRPAVRAAARAVTVTTG